MAKINELGNITIVKFKGIGTALKGVYTVFAEAQKQDLKEDGLVEFLLEGIKKINNLTKKDEDRLKEVLPLKYERFKKGEPDKEEDNKAKVDIKLLGSGTGNYLDLEKEAMAAVIELDVNGPFLQIRDPERISEYGMIPMPALVINGKIVSSGRVVKKDEIKKMIMEAIQRGGYEVK